MSLAGQIIQTKLSIQLIQQKKLLLIQIKSAPLPEHKGADLIALTQLLINIKCRIQSFGEAAKRHRWLIKRVKMNSK